MRVMLIRPPAKHTVESEVPEAVSAENLSYPPRRPPARSMWWSAAPMSATFRASA